MPIESTFGLLNDVCKLSNELLRLTKNFMEESQNNREIDPRNAQEKIQQNLKYLMETTNLIGIGCKIKGNIFI